MNNTIAILGIFLVTILWGSWFQTVKHISNFPVHSYISLMYTSSVPIVWISIILLNQKLIPNGIFNEIFSRPSLTLIIFICGIVFGIAMQLHLSVVKRVGLILSTSVSATCAILGGTVVSVIFAGIPENSSLTIIVISSILLILATVICQIAGVKKNEDLMGKEDESPKASMKDILSLAFINFVLMSSYPLANSLGLRSTMNPDGFSSLTCMGILVLGACVGSWCFTFAQISFKEVEKLFKENNPSKLLLLSSIAAMCHFGGNVLHACCAPTVSVTIATVMGNSYHVWSYVWGLAYGEFKGASKKTMTMLFVGISLFIIGVLLLSI